MPLISEGGHTLILTFLLLCFIAAVAGLVIRTVKTEAKATRLLALKWSSKTMTILSEKIAALGIKIDEVAGSQAAASASQTAAIGRVEALIAELQALVDAGGASPEDLAALDALNTKLVAMQAVEESQKSESDSERA
jgi:multisubunit Na+/H+ antiporter MnhF subunit